MRDFTNQYELTLTINGRPLTEYDHTDGNTYVEGRPGSEYAIEIRNCSNERILVVPAVDGLSVMDGLEAGIHSSGYVLAPHGFVSVPGWTRNNNSVAKFEFGDMRNSYSNQMGSGTSNTGVLGLMVFREAQVYYRPLTAMAHTASPMRKSGQIYGSGALEGNTVSNAGMDTLSVNSTFDAAESAPAQELGTEYGQESTFNTTATHFNRRDKNHPDALLALYYDSAKGLTKRGIILGKKHNPDAFPGYTNVTGAKAPPGWVKRR